jgi:two-component system, sensor histidine kinase
LSNDAPPRDIFVVLLVDDQLIVGEAVRRLLAGEPDIDFHYCASSADAVGMTRLLGPDVILQDLVMPGTNGLELLRAYRSDPATRSVPIVVLSTKEEPLIKSEAFAFGASDYLVKLPDRIELLARVRHHARSRRNQLERDRAYEDLIALNRQLEQATRAKSEFLAHMSHEIRTPMNGVIGMTEVLLRGALTPEQRDYVETIRTSGESLLTILNDILDFSKVEQGKLEIEAQPFALRKTVEDVRKLLTPRAAEKGVDLLVRVEDGGRDLPDIVIGDVTRVRQVLINLVGNAIKFTRHGSVTVSIGAGLAEARDRLRVRIAVADTGIGIPADKLHRLFEAFSQVDASTTREFGGTGLGLAISKRLVEAMGGRLWVESEAGRGSTFHCEIVVGAPADAVRTPSAIRPAAAVAPSTPERAPLRVLLADDNAINRKVGVALLGTLGCTVDVVNDGAEAVAQIGARAYDLVFLDVQMPVMDGYEAARRIRTAWAGRDAARPRLIAMTANARQVDRDRCLEAGMDDFLGKPLQLDTLQALVQRCARQLVADRPS